VAKIFTYATPPLLFRYRSISGGKIARELEAINEKYIYCPSIDKLNDQMEGMHRLSSFFSKRSDSAKHHTIINSARQRLGIASFSELLYDEPMWAHYTDQFQGICVAYNFRKLLAELDDEVHLVRMNYNDNAPILLWGRGSVDQDARLTISSKTSRWSYEREWRVISPTKGKTQYQLHNCVTHVYLGSRLDSSDRKMVIKQLESLNISVSEMKLDEYAINFGRVFVSIKSPVKPSRVKKVKTVQAVKPRSK
jgi:hypothetical protein